MKKRIITIALLTLIVLMAGIIIGWLLSPVGQTWGREWLRKPDGLTAIATVLAGTGTVGAVIVALFGIRYERKKAQEDRVESQKRFEDEQARAKEVLNDEREQFEKAQAESQRQFLASQKQTQEALEEGRRQFLEAQYAACRPLLVPVAEFPGNPGIGPFLDEVNWNVDSKSIWLRNVGTGIATNIWGVLMQPETMPPPNIQYAGFVGSPISPTDHSLEVLFLRGRTKLTCEDTIDEHTLCVPKDLSPKQDFEQNARGDKYLARLTLTYHDIFGRKHASIFDFTKRGVWVNRAFVPNIKHDLGEMDEAKDKLFKINTSPSV